MHYRHRVVVEVLRYGEDGFGKIQLDRVVVNLFNRARPLPLPHLGLAIRVLLTRVVLLGQAADQADVRRTGLRVQPALKVEDDIVRGKIVAVAPLYALTEAESPSLEVVRGFPALSEVGPSNVVRTGIGQIFNDVT